MNEKSVDEEDYEDGGKWGVREEGMRKMQPS
jgi:hypothetical protein